MGGSLLLGRATQSLGFPDSPSLNVTHWSYSPGGSVGLLYQLPERWLIGLSYNFPVTYPADTVTDPTQNFPGFFQPVKTPYRLGAGVGWIPNRFFRLGCGLYLIGPSEGVALLSDDSHFVGINPTLQPRLGVEYTAAEYGEFELHINVGSYYEVSRVQDVVSRLHVTGGLEAKIWVVNLGWSLDESRRYENFIYSAGIDVIKVLRKLDLVPPEVRPPYGGLLPKVTYLSDEGLARPLVKDWEDRFKNPNILEIGEQLPERLKDRILKTPKDLQGLGKEILDAIESVPRQIEEEIKKHSSNPTNP